MLGNAVHVGWGEITGFAALCEQAGVNIPPSIVAAFHSREVAEAHLPEPVVELSKLTDDEIRDYLDKVAIRRAVSGTAPLLEAHRVFEGRLFDEVVRAIGPELEDLVDEMRPRLDALATPFVAVVQKYGFNSRTESDNVIDSASDFKTVEAWRSTAPFFATMQPLLAVRTSMSRTFNASPTRFEQNMAGTADPVDYSVAFAAGDNWDEDGTFYINGILGGHLDWFRLALGGIRLNSPAEVRQKQAARMREEVGV